MGRLTVVVDFTITQKPSPINPAPSNEIVRFTMFMDATTRQEVTDCFYDIWQPIWHNLTIVSVTWL
jgi:hypothetical protein